jgi:C1A family cysteine protease
VPTNRGLGWVRDPAKRPDDTQDLRAEPLLRAAPAPPPAASEAEHILSILDQGHYSSCVAHACMQAIRARHSRLGVKNPKLGSRWWAYYLSRASHGDQLRDEGTWIRACFGALRKFGFPTEDVWPYDDNYEGVSKYKCMPPVAAFWRAADQRSPVAYYRITAAGEARVVECKRAIAAGYTIAWGTLVTQAFCDGDYGSQYVGLPQQGDPVVGGHAMLLAAYDERGFSGPNSWGEGWGDRGWFHFKPEVIAWPESDDFWICENVPKFLEAAP